MGSRLAEVLVAFLDDPHRFKSSKQVGSYVGLTPRQYQSGLSNHQGRISVQGNKLLRTLPVEISWISLRCHPHGQRARGEELRYARRAQLKELTIIHYLPDILMVSNE